MKHEPMIHVVAFSLLSHLKFIGLIIKNHWDIKCDFPQKQCLLQRHIGQSYLEIAYKLSFF